MFITGLDLIWTVLTGSSKTSVLTRIAVSALMVMMVVGLVALWFNGRVNAAVAVKETSVQNEIVTQQLQTDHRANEIRQDIVAENHQQKTEIAKRVDRFVAASKERDRSLSDASQAHAQIYGLWAAWCDTQTASQTRQECER